MATVVLGSSGTMKGRHFLRRHIVEPDEWFGAAPDGVYDVKEFLKTLPQPFQSPSLLLIFFEFGLYSQPVNLAGVTCPRVLVIGDTHHRTRPLSNALKHALAEPYDLVVGQFVRQHLHFFREAGLSQTVWIPSFTLNPYELKPAAKCRPTLFIGGTDRHPYRKHVLSSLEAGGSAVPVGAAGPDFAALEYNRTQINLNISMNGDLNLRNFEVLAAHGFLISDRLSPESGMELLFQEQRHLVLFDSPGQLRDLISHYLAHPSCADAIAADGHAHYLRHHTPAHRIQQLHAALAGKVTPAFSLDLDPRSKLPPAPLPRLLERVRLYEVLQELHRCNPECVVLFWEGLDREALDAVDMPRTRVSLLARPGIGLVDTCGMQSRIERLPPGPLAWRRWGLLSAPPEALKDPLLHQALAQRVAPLILVPHFDAAVHTPELQALIQKFHLHHQVPSHPPLLALPGVPIKFMD